MEKFVGIDVHKESCTIAIVDGSGKRIRSQVVDTKAQIIIEAVKAVRRPVRVCIEEGTQAAWIHELLSPHVDELVVAQAIESRGAKNDLRDAFALAESLRAGTLPRTIFKAPSQFSKLRALAHSYESIVCDAARAKMRIGAIYRGRGVDTDASLFDAGHREWWLARLPPTLRPGAEVLHIELEGIELARAKVTKELVAESHQHKISSVLETCPGLGPIRVGLLIPTVITPFRFRTKRQFWSYCGLGIVMRSSSDWVRSREGQWTRAPTMQPRGLSIAFNRTLKNIYKGAAMTVVQMKKLELHGDYQRLLEKGIKPNLARLTIARRIAAISLALWKTQEVYDPKKHMQQRSTSVTSATSAS